MKKVFLSVWALGLFVLPAYATKGMRENAKSDNVVAGRTTNFKPNRRAKKNGIVKVKSNYSVSETAQRFEAIAKERGLKIIAKVDHAAGAQSVNKELRPTQLIIFGNPAVGTPLMQCNQTTGIDLPQKALIWKDEQGQVWLGYNSPRYLLIRHQLRGCGEEVQQALQRVGNALNSLAQEATK
ncbi:MAG: DUF302 domain-containing protein [Calothrix sp. MO_192.B10]|nr:DUF302 domain-containing protein [Calothrix sp. MO_192.B10]